MKGINFKIELTWQDIAKRMALVIGTVAIIVWFMPRDNKPSFKVELDKVWRHSDMTAMFDFPVYKTDSVIQIERKLALKAYEPYYIYDKEKGQQQEHLFITEIGQKYPGLSGSFITAVSARIRQLYKHGIVDTKKPMRVDDDSVRAIRRIDDKEATSIAISSVFTPVEAYEQIMLDPALMYYHEVISKMDINNYLVPNLTYDKSRSEESMEDLVASVPLAVGVVQRGQKIVSRGDLVDENTYQIITSYLKEIELRHKSDSTINSTVVGEMIFVALLIGAFTIYLSIYRRDYFERIRSAMMIYALITLAIVNASLLVEHNLFHVYILPFAIVPIFIRVFMDSRTAFMAHIVVVLICATILQRPLEFISVEIAAGLAAIFSLRELSSRSQLFWTAIITSGVAMLTNLAVYLIRSGNVERMDHSDYVFLVLSGIILFCCYPLLYLIEKFFGFISDITLIELSDMNKDLLRRMSEVAPGTFQHSIQVGNLAAEIARKIGGNPQLVRTGALYHDIGKTQNPIYFTENQSGGISPHEQLTYIESAQMIISHVTEGLKLANQHNLPNQIRDFIATHHGLGKAKYFYIKYKNEHPDEAVDDLLFTYPGPNPFTKEQAILMMADSVEAASRSLPDYTEQTIRSLVNRIVNNMVDEGYFRECPITFRDIAYAQTVMIEKLKTIYHTRISYPEEKKNGA
jgi:hypothetical protein